jgi:glycosyltransferase involved in cell wall biosynthesis
VVKYQAEAARAAALGAPVHVIPNGVPLLDPPAAGSADGHVVFGTLARLDPRKRIDLLLDALRQAAPRLPPHELRIAGGPERDKPGHLDELKRLSRGLSVAFVGEERDPARFLRELDCFALVAEPAGCPNASLEAMAAGLPVVATQVGGMADQIDDGVNGRLVGREDVPALAAALVQVGRDAALRRSMGAAARAKVAAQFGMPRMIDGYMRLCLG